MPNERYNLDSEYSQKYVALYYQDALSLMRKEHLFLYKYQYMYVSINTDNLCMSQEIYLQINHYVNSTVPHTTPLLNV